MQVEEVIKQWEADEARVRARQSAPGAAPRGAIFSRSGIEVFAAMFTGELPPPPINETSHILAVHIEPGIAVFQGRPNESHYNPLGTVHGGWFATLLDSAVGCAVHSTLPAGKGYTTLELNVNMLRALSTDVPLVRAEGRVVHGGRQVAMAEGQIVGPDGKIYAHATTTCLLFEQP